MNRHNRKTALLLASFLGVGLLSTGAIAASADETSGDGAATTVDLSESYKLGDLPYHTQYSNFGYYDAGYVKYVMKAGVFDATAADYGLKAFDTKVTDNKISLSTVSGLEIENWKWVFAADSSVVIEVVSAVEGTVTFDYSGVTLGGWMEPYNTLYSVYRKNAANGSLDTLVNYYHGVDSVSNATMENGTASALYTVSVDVKEGDTVYYQVGSLGAGRNLQSMTAAKIVVNPSVMNETVVGTYSKKLDSQVAALVESNYAPSDWEAIKGYVSTFKAGTYTTADALYTAYTTAKANIEAVKPDPLKDKRTKLLKDIKELYDSFTEGNFTAENWTVVKNAYDSFVAGAEACETEEALNALYDEKVAAMNSVVAYKQDFTYLDYPEKMNANGYSWIEGDVFDTKLYTGGVESGLKEFDKQGDTKYKMYNSELNAELDSYAYYAENWRWIIGRDAGVIVAFKANVDCKIVVTDTRIAGGSETNGWTADCVLNSYIVRDGVVKQIASVNAPSSDEDFSGVYYAKAGDIIYIEFNSFVINVGSTRNTQAPCNTTVKADGSAFDADAYAEQNHDLPAEVTAEIEAKTQALNEYFASLKEEDYSATNWLTLDDYIDQFISKCETEVETVADVTALYDQILAEMKAVPTLAQAAEELQTTLEGYVAELQAEYDKLVAANDYTTENKTALDKALADGISAIRAATSKAAGNTAKRNAINALAAIEKTAKTSGDGSGEASGCGSAIGLSAAIAGIAALVGAGVLVSKKKKD